MPIAPALGSDSSNGCQELVNLGQLFEVVKGVPQPAW
jgi:hypothetical protein